MILIVILYAILAITFIVAKTTVVLANPVFLIGSRMTAAGIVMLCGYRVVCGPIAIKRQDWWLLFKTMLFHIYFAFIFEFWALQYVSALKTTIFYSISPFITALFAFVLIHEKLSVHKILGICVGFCGLLPIFMLHADGSHLTSLVRISLPDCVMLLAVMSAAYAWFLVKRLMVHYDLFVINGLCMFGGGILSLITAGFCEGYATGVTDWPLFLCWLIVLILLSNVVAYNLYGYLLRHYSITLISFAGFLCPIFTAFFEWFLGIGALSWHYAVACMLVTVGLYLFYYTTERRV